MNYNIGMYLRVCSPFSGTAISLKIACGLHDVLLQHFHPVVFISNIFVITKVDVEFE